jgi:hypothetical protein
MGISAVTVTGREVTLTPESPPVVVETAPFLFPEVLSVSILSSGNASFNLAIFNCGSHPSNLSTLSCQDENGPPPWYFFYSNIYDQNWSGPLNFYFPSQVWLQLLLVPPPQAPWIHVTLLISTSYPALSVGLLAAGGALAVALVVALRRGSGGRPGPSPGSTGEAL